jgi:Trk K+ transport system NAD-binding subunit
MRPRHDARRGRKPPTLYKVARTIRSRRAAHAEAAVKIARRRTPRWYKALATDVRDTLVLFSQFRGSVVSFSLVFIGGGWLYFTLAHRIGEARPASLAEGAFLVLSMIFLQANADFPNVWYLQLFFFVMPVLGLSLLSRGAADFGALLFNRRARGEAWQVAVAATYSNHIVIVGLDHLGFRIARALHELDESFVAIELKPDAELVSQVQSWNVPIIQGDANKLEVLQNAGVDRAHTIILTTNDDTLNLQIAIHARAVSPQIRTIVRLFDDDFAREVQNSFGITAAYSASALAAPAFAAAAAGLDIAEAVTVNGRVLNMTHFVITPPSKLAGKTVGQLEDEFDASVVLLRRGRGADLHPDNDTLLIVEDQITVFAEASTLHRLNRLNK